MIKKLSLLVIIMQFIFFKGLAQFESLSDADGLWLDDAQWVGGTSPGVSPNNDDIDIYGKLIREGDLSYNNGLITVHDTLIIKGNLSLLNNGDLSIDSTAVVIIFGDYSCNNQVIVDNGGYFIVTGDFEMVGSDSQGSFENSGSVYIFDDEPDLKSGANYAALECNDPDSFPSDCGYGGEMHIVDDPIYSFFASTSCSGTPDIPTITGETDVYDSVGYTYVTEQGMSNYGWTITDGTIISGQGTNAVVIDWDSSGSPTIKVVYEDTSGCYVISDILNITLVELIPVSCFTYRRHLSINNSVVNGGEDLTDFPFLIKIQNDTLKHVSEGGHITHYGGYDIFFSQNSDGTAKLDHQIDYYDPINGELWVWVKIPVLSASVLTEVYMFYGNNGIKSDLSTDAVWSKDYVAVYHMGESLRDYGPTENYGQNYGTEPIAGQIAHGRDFERDETDFINITNEPDFRFDTTMSFSFWMYIESYPAAGGGENDLMDVLIKGDSVNFRLVCNRTDESAYFSFGNGGAQGDLISAIGAVPAGSWVYVAGTWDGNIATASERKKLFINNVFVSNDPGGQDLSADFAYNTFSTVLGYNQEAPNTRSFDGRMDEVRISSGWRSNGWVLTEYNNQLDPTAYLTDAGEVEVYSLGSTGGTVEVADDSLLAHESTTAVLTAYSGNIQWQYSNDNIGFYDLTGEIDDTLVTDPLLETTYYRTLVYDGNGCASASNVDSVIVEPGYIDCGYSSRMQINIGPDKVSGSDDLLNFPLLIDITESNLASVGNGGKVANNLGYDIIFTFKDGVTILPHEVEQYDSTTGHLRAWVNVPTLYPDDTTSLFIYYGNSSGVDNPSTSLTWGNVYLGVWHMENDLLDAADSSNNGTNTGTIEVAGRIGNARQFNGASDYITITNESDFDIAANGQLTVSAWVYADAYSDGNQEQFVNKGANSWYLRKYGTSGSSPEFYQQYSGDSLFAYNSNGVLTGSWHYLTATFDHSLNSAIVYIDGSSTGSVKNSPGSTVLVNNNNQVRFGADAGGAPSNYFEGKMDEVRIQNVARKADWIKTEYLNQSNPSGFISIVPEESCISVPLAGTASASPSFVCNGQTTSIVLSGSSGSIYWQESSDSINWSYITGENDSVLIVGPLTDTMFYRASISGCCELYSNEIRIDYIDAVPPIITDPGDKDTCVFYVLPVITGSNLTGSEAYFTDHFGAGLQYNPGDTLFASDTLYIYDNNGSCIDEVDVIFTINPLPIVGISIADTSGILDNDGILCLGDTSTLTASGGVSYLWCTSATSTSIKVTNGGNYTVMATDANGCSNSDSVTITVNGLPTAGISITENSGTTSDDGILCLGDTATLTASGGTNYVWFTSETTTSINVVNGGECSVIVTDGNGCSDSDTVTLSFNNLPTASISITETSGSTNDDGELCTGDTATLSINGGTSYFWSTGDTADSINVVAANDYSVKVTDTNQCSNYDTVAIVLHEVPELTTPDTPEICSGESFDLSTITINDANSTGAGYTYHNDTPATGANELPSADISPATTTVYYILGDNSGCTDELGVTVSVLANINVVAINNGPICSGSDVQLSETGGEATSWLWRSDGSATFDDSTSQTPIASGAVDGETFTVEVSNGTCINTATTTVSVTLPIPKATAENNGPICNGSDVQLSETGGEATSWFWSSDGSATFDDNTSQTPVVSGAVDGENFTVEVSNGTCTNTATTTVSVDLSTIIARAENNGPICSGSDVQLSETGGEATSWLWSSDSSATFDDNTSQTPIASGAVDGETFTVEAGNGTCITIATTVVEVDPSLMPSIDSPDNQVVCDSYELPPITGTNLTGNQAYYTESSAGGSVYNQGDIIVSSQTLYLYDASGNCVAEEQLNIVIHTAYVDLGDDAQICEGESYTFSPGNYVTYIWHDNSNDGNYTTTNEEEVILTVIDENGCEDSDTAFVQVFSSPELNLGPDTVLCSDDGYQIFPGNFEFYDWSTGASTSTITVYPGIQTITLTVTDINGCETTDEIQILECTDDILGEIDNVFTPNGDGYHDTWLINGLELFSKAKVEVFDRWGRRVFLLDGGYSGRNAWNGTYKGRDLPIDNYYYVIDLYGDGTKLIKGNVSIVK